MEEQKMIEALTRLADAQESQTKEWNRINDGLTAINSRLDKIDESIKCIDQKLDETTKETTINTERIQNLKEQHAEEKKETSDRFRIAHDSIRRSEGRIKWVFATIILPVVLSLVAIFKPN